MEEAAIDLGALKPLLEHLVKVASKSTEKMSGL
jgi:hypothetical protein